MAKQSYSPPTSIDQDPFERIGSSISKIRSIAELFISLCPNEGRDLSGDACNGILLTLQEAAYNIEQSALLLTERPEVSHAQGS